jgi:hypothetical protein
MQLPEATNLDWCSNLIINLDSARSVRTAAYYARDMPLTAATFEYKDDGGFNVGMTRRARFDQHYSRTCMTQYGYAGDCSSLKDALEKHSEGNPAVSRFECAEQRLKGGCDCSFQYEEVSVLNGVFNVQSGAISHFSQSPALRYSQAGFCVRGDSLEISGRDNSFVLDRLGLRSVELTRVNCDDGNQSPGEEGVDCGPVCEKRCM